MQRELKIVRGQLLPAKQSEPRQETNLVSHFVGSNIGQGAFPRLWLRVGFLKLPDQTLWAIELKSTTSPKVTRGFHIAAEDMSVADRLLVYASDRDVPGQGGVRPLPLTAATSQLKSL